jgi:hypothetical protein
VPARAYGGKFRRIGRDEPRAGETVVVLDSPGPGVVEFIEAAKAAGARVLIDADDDLYAREVPVAPFTVGVEPGDVLNRWLGIAPGQQTFMVTSDDDERAAFRRYTTDALAAADAVSVTTPTLAASLARSAQRVAVAPNALPSYLDAPQRTRAAGRPLRVGYASGGISARDDAELVRDALGVAASTSGVQAVLIGFNPHTHFTLHETSELAFAIRTRDTDRLAALAEQVHARRSRWTFPFVAIPASPDMRQYRAAVATIDVGLAPIDRRAEFSLSRSASKALDYAAAGVACVLDTAAPPYMEWAGNVPAASSAADFTAAVSELLDHPDAIASAGADARAYALAEHSHATPRVRAAWRSALFG